MRYQITHGVHALFEPHPTHCTSSDVPRAISTHDAHTPQGSPSAGCRQFSALAKIRAEDVFPVPRGR